jgi:hypothetical protein
VKQYPALANKLGKGLLFVVVVCIFLAYAGSGLHKQFTRGADVAGWTVSTAANSLSILDTDRWLPYGVGFPLPELDPLENLLYLHQSPLPYYITSAAFAVFGVKESVARFIPLACILAAGFLLYGLLSRLWNPTVATLGLAAYFFNPTIVTFATADNHIVIAQFTVLLAFALWLRSHDMPRSRARFMVAYAATLLAMWTYWHAYFLPFIFAYESVRPKSATQPSYRRAAIWLALPAVAFALHLLLYVTVYKMGPFELLSTALQRSGVSGGAWTPLKAVRELIVELANLWQGGVVALSVAFIASRFLPQKESLTSRQTALLISLGLPPLAYWICMPRIATVEPMFNLVLIAPFVSTCFALGATQILGHRLLPVPVALLLLALIQIAADHDKWRHRLYAHRPEDVQVSILARDNSNQGDVIFEHHTGIGPGIVAFYARGRAVLNSENFLLRGSLPPADYMLRILEKLSPHRSTYLLTAAHGSDLESVEKSLLSRQYTLRQMQERGGWKLMAIDRPNK